MALRAHRGTYVFDVVYEETGEKDVVTLDSGAGVSVWPKNKMPELRLEPKQKGLKMVAANGSAIENFGQKVVAFHGKEIAAVDVAPASVFNGPMP